MVDSELTLHESAELLGVHYMTVYRYVRLGLLPADKVRGTWRVLSADLAAFRALAVALPTTIAPIGRRRAPWRERIEARLLAGDAQGAWGVIEAALSAGASLDDIYLEVLEPALRSVHARSVTGEVDVSVERRASVIVMRLIGRLGPRFTRRGRTRGIVVVGSAAGGTTGSIGLTAVWSAMVADIVRRHGWEVFDLGGEVPAAGFAHMAVATAGLVAVGLVVVDPPSVDAARDATRAIRASDPLVPIVVCGEAAVDAAGLGHDRLVAGPRQFADVLDAIASPGVSPGDAPGVTSGVAGDPRSTVRTSVR